MYEKQSPVAPANVAGSTAHRAARTAAHSARWSLELREAEFRNSARRRVGFVAIFVLTLVLLLGLLGPSKASAQSDSVGGGPVDLSGVDLSGGASAPNGNAVQFVHLRIELLESEQTEFAGLAQGAVDASARGDIDPQKGNEIFRFALGQTTQSDEEIRRLNSMVNAGVPFGIDVAVFPVGDVTEFINSWGFARSGGRRHKGTDILAPRGADLYAIEAGVIERQGDSQLGGLSVYLLGDSGSRYYYTHLHELGPQVAGERVNAGDVVGLVGDSGNARGTPHLHFQWAPDGKTGWVNPYPLLEGLWIAENDSQPPAR